MAVGRTNWIALMVVAAGLLLIPAAPAEAGDGEIVTAPIGTHYGNGRCGVVQGGCDADRGGCHNPCGGRAYGSSWSSIRYHLSGKERIRRRYLQYYFIRRYPFRRGATRRFSSLTPEARAGINRHGVTFLRDVRRQTNLQRAADVGLPRATDIGNPRGGFVYANAISKIAEEDPRPDAIDYLNRGMARFYEGMYKEAELDFETALTGKNLVAARYGRMLCAVIRGKWDRVAGDLGRMANAGELHADDRLLIADTFRKRVAFPSILEGLEGYVRYKGGASANLVAAWAFVAAGRVDEAAPYLRRVKRTMPEHAALPILEAAVTGLAPKAPKPKATPVQQPEPVESMPEPVHPTAPALRPASAYTAPLADSKAG